MSAPMHEPVRLQIRDSQRPPVETSLEVEAIPIGRRVLRASVRLIGLWALAAASFFIPLVHFVSIPGLAIAGVVMAVLAARASVEVRSTEVTCPKCELQTPIEKGTTGWPVHLWCKHCGTSFNATITRQAG